MRFLIDECLTIDLVAVANQAGFQAEHVAHIGKAGWKDWNVVRYAVQSELIVVTNNAGDFQKLYAIEKLHPGLVILIPNVSRDQQQALFGAVLEELNSWGEPINQVVEADLDGEEAILTIYELSLPEG